jgi:fructokinase
MTRLYGGMEGGGTKFVCAVGTGPDTVREELRFPVTNPTDTLAQAIAFFKSYQLDAIGLAPFGPLDLDRASPTYGSITATPKPGWSGTNIVSTFQQQFNVPLAFDLDVNAAAYGEYTLVSGNRSFTSLVYFTIGTGIGAGVIANGQIIHGLTHPEAGHVRLPHDWSKDPFPGECPFHGDCFEGLASGSALSSRWGQRAVMLPDEHPAWDMEAGYIAAALVNVIMNISPQRIILGGGVMERGFLFPLIRQKVKSLLGGYIASPEFSGNLDRFIIPPNLGNRSGVLGALAMAVSIMENLA